jgi:hypothetical protein
VPKVTFKVFTVWIGKPGAVVAKTFEANSKPKFNALQLNMLNMLMCSLGSSGLSGTFLVASYIRCSDILADAHVGVLVVL